MNEANIAKADAILEHHGVKGMRWGTRKGSSKSSGVRTPSASRAGKKAGHRNADPRKLNNHELKKVVARMKLEQEFVQLNQKTAGEGKKLVHDILKQAPKAAAGAVVAGTTGFILKSLLEGNKASKVASKLKGMA